MEKYNIHADFKKYGHLKVPFNPKFLPIINATMKKMLSGIKVPKGISCTKIQIPGYKGGLFEADLIEPENVKDSLPCIIFLHGGAFALRGATYHKRLAFTYAMDVKCKILFVDYRLAPEFPFPYGLEDSYAALKWLNENANETGIDINRIAVLGDSAGAALAAGLCMLAKQRGKYRICFQMLIYPVTDSRQITDSMIKYTDTPLWNSKLNKRMWNLYLPQLPDGYEKGIASPMESENLRGLPPAYIEVCEFDCLHDEGVNYAKKLEKSDVKVLLTQTKGTIHGYDIEEESSLVKKYICERENVLRNIF